MINLYYFSKKCFFILLSFFSLLFLVSSTPIYDNEFYLKIHNYQTYNDHLYNLYYQEYQSNNNLVFTLNKINHPNFLTYSNSTKPAFYFFDKSGNKYLFINRKYGIEKSFTPKNLVEVFLPKVDRNNQKMLIDQKTQEMYQNLYLEALLLNLNLIIYSAYREYDYQSKLYDNAKDKSFVAKPGYSEHQTGQAIDIATSYSGLTNHFEKTKEFIFLKNNAHRYGFILRYPKEKEIITGYSYESWHFRYVGIEIATFIYEHNLTLEEYIYQFVEVK